MPDPVSWLLVEPGWSIVGADGNELGKVSRIVGDTNADIFNGLAATAGLLREERYIPAELVEAIVEGSVKLTIGQDEFDRLDSHDEPGPHLEIKAE